MSATGLEVFDRTLQTTNTSLGEIMETLGPDRQIAWHALGAVLRTVRDRIPLGLGLAPHLGAQLPLLVRGAYGIAARTRRHTSRSTPATAGR